MWLCVFCRPVEWHQIEAIKTVQIVWPIFACETVKILFICSSCLSLSLSVVLFDYLLCDWLIRFFDWLITKTSLFDHQADMNTLSSQNQTIHTTTIDSTTRKYNFRSFSTMELPIILQAHIGKFTPYIGFNLAYSFKLNTTSITKNYAVKDTVILNNSLKIISFCTLLH